MTTEFVSANSFALRTLLFGSLFVVDACSDPSTQTSGQFALRFSTESEVMQCPSASCAEFGVGCGGALMIRWTDLDGNLAVNRDGQPLEICRDIAPAFDLCALNDLLQELRFNAIDDGTYELQVALWEQSKGCSDLSFDSQGRPQPSTSPPAIAGSVYVDTAKSSDVVVSLACPNAQQLNEVACWQAGARLQSSIVNLSTLTTINSFDDDIFAQGNKPIEFSDPDQTFHQFTSEYSFSLSRNALSPASISGESDNLFEDVQCTSVLELNPPGSAASATCTLLSSPEVHIDMVSYLAPRDLQDAIINSFGFEGSFPEEGFVLGRVVNAAGNPVAGVEVRSTSGSVDYWSITRDTLQTGATSGNGYFFSTEAAFGSAWTATHTDGRIETQIEYAGLIRNQITTLVIQIGDP